jgi:hypothetical protein
MVYLLKANNFYKIGITKNKVSNRVRVLQTGCPFKIEIFDTFETRNDLSVENALHKIFRNKRTYGEWFELLNEDIEKLYSTIDYIQNFTKENDNMFLTTKESIIYNMNKNENKIVSVEIVKCKKINERQDGTLDIMLLDDREHLSVYASEVI